MARKSLSSQVIEEVDRACGLLKPVQDIVDPMTAHMVGAVLESLHRVETMCLAAMQRDVNAVTADSPLAVAFEGDQLSTVRRRSATTKRKPTSHKGK